jgi:GNAT superfamily N-acetyltransferase
MSVGNPDRPVGGLAVRPPPGIDLQPLGRGDLADAVALARELHRQAPLDDVEPLLPRLDALLASADVAPFLAVDDSGRAAGLGILHFRRRLNFATFEGWISELIVRSEARGGGIGRALLHALVAEWRLRGSHRLQIQVPDQAAAAEALLSGAGFEAWMVDFVQRPVVPFATNVPAGVTLRPAADADGEPVTRLLSEFGAPRTPASERLEAVRRTFEDHLRRVRGGEARTMVAELDGAAVGVCSVEWRDPFWTAETHAWLPDLIVTESARGRGIGRALLADAVTAAAAHGVAQLSLESGRARTSAHALYRSSGFAETGQTFRLPRVDP